MSPQYYSPGVYMVEVERGAKPIEGVGTAIAAFVGFAKQGPINEPTLITNWTQFVNTFGSFIPGGYLAHAIYGYYANGGAICYVTRLGDGAETLDGSVPQSIAAAAELGLPGRATPGTESLTMTAQANAKPGDIVVEISGPAEGAPEDQFSMTVRRGETVETFANVTMSKGRRNVVEVVNRESKLVKLAEKESAASPPERTPNPGSYTLTVPTVAAVAKTPGREVESSTFIGDATKRSGINGLEIAEEATMICVPDLMGALKMERISAKAAIAVQQALITHCDNMKDRVAILDCPPDLGPQQVRDWRLKEANFDSKYAALYYPWIKVADPIGNGEPITVPPCGHIAGIWARTDAERGVHKAPANEKIQGAIEVAYKVSKNEQDTLNPDGVNCIRAFPGRGIRVWGARTVSNDAAWRYINVRRLFNFIEKSIERGTQWVVFEPNDEDLWRRIRRDVTAFLLRVWRDGALFGTVAEEAFYVKCDRELNPPEVRDAGQVIIEVGLAPVKPAEFVIFRISQFSGVAE